ncbi:MAG: hypothetical protein SNJ72_08510 [Fimbriimonadales bacterium]
MRLRNWLFGILVGTTLLAAPVVAQQQERCCSFRVRHNFKFCLNQGQIANGVWSWNLNAFVANPPSTNTNAGSMNFTIPPSPFNQTQSVTNQIAGPNGQTCAISGAAATINIEQVQGTNCYEGHHEVLGRACAFCRGFSAGGWGSTHVFLATQGVQGGQVGWQPIIQDQAQAGCEVQTVDPVVLKGRDRNTGALRQIILFSLEAQGWNIDNAGNQIVLNSSSDRGTLHIQMNGAEVGGLDGALQIEYANGVYTNVRNTGYFATLQGMPRAGESTRPIRLGISEFPLSFNMPSHLVLEGIEFGGGGQAGEVPRVDGDVNGDGCVDDADLLMVLFAFGGQGGAEDVNGDGIVDDADLLIVLFNFGSGC